MWAKFSAQFVMALATELIALVPKGIRAISSYFEKKKKIERAQQAARKVENAETPADIRTSVDDLP